MKTDDASNFEEGDRGIKIGILCSPVSWGEENYRMVEKLIAEYGEENFIISVMPDDGDVQTTVSLATKMASDPDCGVIICNEAAVGIIAAFTAARQINPDLLTFAINPGEEPLELSEVTDFMCLQALEEFGYMVADAANEKGIEVIVVQAPSDQLGQTAMQRRIAGTEERCAEYGIEVVTTTLPPQADTSMRPQLEQATKEDVYNKLEQYGDKVGFFPMTSFLYVPVITAMLDEKEGYLICPADPGPFSPAYSDAFQIAAPDDHVLDIDWTNQAIADKIAEYDMIGHFGNWEMAYLSSWMKACVEYSREYLAGEVDKEDMEEWLDLYAEANNVTRDDFSVGYYDVGGEEMKNVALVAGKICWYGEDIGTE